MKRFLSILLALAVGFTFTFGSAMSAFAADPKYYALADLEKEMYGQVTADLAAFETVKAAFLAGYTDNVIKTGITANNIDLSKESVEVILPDFTDAMAASLNAKVVEQKQAANALVQDNYFYTEQTLANEGAFNAFAAGKEVYYKNSGVYTKTTSFVTAVTTYYTRTDKGFTEAQKDVYVDAVHNVYKAYDTAAKVKDLIDADVDCAKVADDSSKYAKKALTNEHAIQKAEVVAELATVKAADYSDTVPADAGKSSKYYFGADSTNPNNANLWDKAIKVAGYCSYKAQVEAALAYFQKELDKQDIDDADNAAAIATKMLAEVEAVGTDKNMISEADWLTALEAMIDGIPTVKQEGYDATDLATAKELAIQRLNATAAQLKATEKAGYQATIIALERKASLTAVEQKSLNDAKDGLANADAGYAAVVEVETYKINEMTVKATIEAKTWTAADFEATDRELSLAKSAKVASLKAEATSARTETTINGTLMYTAEIVDLALENAIAVAYNAANIDAVNAVTLGLAGGVDPVKARMAYVLDVTGATTFEINQKIYTDIAQWEILATGANYDDDKLVEVKAAIDEAKAAIRAAKTVEAVDAAFIAGHEKIDAVLTKGDRDTAQEKDEYKDKAAEYATEIGIVVDNAVARDAKFLTDRGITDKADFVAALVGTADNDKGLFAAYNLDEMKAIYDEAVATINSLQTVEAKKAEAKAINEAIAAVKLPVTAADAETILALVDRVDAFNDVMTMTGEDITSYNLLTDLLTSMLKSSAAIEKKAIEDALAEVAKGGVTLTEEATVEALADRVNAYKENYTVDVAGVVCNADDVNGANVFETNFTVLHAKAVEDAINKIDPTANPVDAAAVKAAREAYDALGETRINDAQYSKLLSLEVLVAQQEEANKYDTTKVKSFLQDATVKASSTVSGKKVTVTANADVQELIDNGYTVEFKFFKSKKASSGYKSTVTKNAAESKTYTNTKASKGANYYKYIIIVTDAEGNEVAKTTLKECAYAKRTIK